MLTTYCFPSQERAVPVERLAAVLPEPLKKVFRLTTGSEAVECAIKLARAWGIQHGGRGKNGIVCAGLASRQTALAQIDAAGVLATPANSRFNELVIEAGRQSILNDGREATINYDLDSVQLT